MSYITKGNFQMVGGVYAVQPDRSVTEKNDGTLEGTVTYRADLSNQFGIPQLGDPHHDNPKLEMYQRDQVFNSLGYVTVTGSFFGLANSPTTKVITYSGGQNNDPIETHPDFASFAGTGEAELNGALWDKIMDENNQPKLDADDNEMYQFLGFKNESDSPSTANFLGTEYYLTPSTLVSVSYWTNQVPSLRRRMQIVNSIPGFVTPPDVENFLLLDEPYRQVGNFYQVTEQYLGSGAQGWNPLIYDNA